MSVRIEVPGPVRKLIEQLEAAGYETWAVGGAVRDALRGSPAEREDWDLATRATPAQMREVFGRTIPLGPEYGTLGVFGSDGVLYEVTTFRRDVVTYGRKARVAFAETLDEDLSRRDFTVNAMAWHPGRKILHDPHGGARDLKAGILRTVGDPSERFREDYLRVLRGLRFAGVLGLEIEAGTWDGMTAAVPGLDRLSRERVREELMKVLAGRAPSGTLGLYRRCGALERVLGGMSPEAGRGALATVDAVGEPDGAGAAGDTRLGVVRLAALLLFGAGAGKDPAAVAELLDGLRFSREEVERVTAAMSGGLGPDPRQTGRPRGTAPLGRRDGVGRGGGHLPGVARCAAGGDRSPWRGRGAPCDRGGQAGPGRGRAPVGGGSGRRGAGPGGAGVGAGSGDRQGAARAPGGGLGGSGAQHARRPDGDGGRDGGRGVMQYVARWKTGRGGGRAATGYGP